VLMPTTLLGGAITFAWPFARSVGSLIAVAFVYVRHSTPLTLLPHHYLLTYQPSYRICVGVFVALQSVPLIRMGEVGDFGRRSGMLYTITSISALCPPILGLLRNGRVGMKPLDIMLVRNDFISLRDGMVDLETRHDREHNRPLCDTDVNHSIYVNGSLAEGEI
jgi:hypothetical protein